MWTPFHGLLSISMSSYRIVLMSIRNTNREICVVFDARRFLTLRERRLRKVQEKVLRVELLMSKINIEVFLMGKYNSLKFMIKNRKKLWKNLIVFIFTRNHLFKNLHNSLRKKNPKIKSIPKLSLKRLSLPGH